MIYVLRGNMFMSDDAFDQSRKGEQLNAARRLLERHVELPEAARRLSREFDLSYVRPIATSSKPASSIDRSKCREASGTDHARSFHRTYGGTCSGRREKQRPDHWSNRDRRVECVSRRSTKAWLSRVKKAAHFKSTFPIRLIACSSRSWHRPTIFWCPVASAPSACG